MARGAACLTLMSALLFTTCCSGATRDASTESFIARVPAGWVLLAKGPRWQKWISRRSQDEVLAFHEDEAPRQKTGIGKIDFRAVVGKSARLSEDAVTQVCGRLPARYLLLRYRFGTIENVVTYFNSAYYIAVYSYPTGLSRDRDAVRSLYTMCPRGAAK